MDKVLVRAGSFIAIIFLGGFLRKKKIVPENAGDAVKKILLYITLPAAIITNFSKISDMGVELLWITFLGIAASVFMIAAAVLLTRSRTKSEQALYIMCLPSYNIGAFGLPFVQSFLPAVSVVAACMFDVGNSIMCTGVTYAFAQEYLAERKQGFRIQVFMKCLLSSVALITYVIMFIVSIAGIRVPDAVISFIEPAANANAFTAMLMIGLLMKFEWKREQIETIAKIMSIRTVGALILASVCYFLLPFDYNIRKALVLMSFAPVPAVAPAYTGMCGGDEGLAGSINTVSIFVALPVLSILTL